MTRPVVASGFYSLGYSAAGVQGLLFSSDDGVTFTQASVPVSKYGQHGYYWPMWTVYNQGKYIAAAWANADPLPLSREALTDNSNKMVFLTSLDAQTWTAAAISLDNFAVDSSKFTMTVLNNFVYLMGYNFFSGGAVLYKSTDGLSWSPVAIGAGFPNYTTHTIFNDGTLLLLPGSTVFGGQQSCYSSNDGGLTWNNDGNFGTATFKCLTIEYHNSIYVAGGTDGVVPAVQVSPDRVTWTSHILPTPVHSGMQINSIAYNPTANVWVVAGGYGQIWYSTDNGVTWNPKQVGTASGSNVDVDVVFGNNKFIYTDANKEVYTSTDAVTWTLYSTMPSAAGVNNFILQFLAGHFLYSSTVTQFTSVTVDNNQTLEMISSHDGLTWNAALSIESPDYSSPFVPVLGTGNGKFLAAGYMGRNGGNTFYMADSPGSSWGASGHLDLTQLTHVTDVVYFNSKWYAASMARYRADASVYQTLTYFVSSSDGSTWSEYLPGITITPYCFFASSGTLYMGGNAKDSGDATWNACGMGTPKLIKTTDGITWTDVPLTGAVFGTPVQTQGITRLLVNGSVILAIVTWTDSDSYNYCQLISSTDGGTTWVSREPFESGNYDLWGLTYAQGFYLVCGGDNLTGWPVLFKSTDGISWTEVSTGFSHLNYGVFTDVAWNGTNVVLCGYYSGSLLFNINNNTGGMFLYSPDLLTWTQNNITIAAVTSWVVGHPGEIYAITPLRLLALSDSTPPQPDFPSSDAVSRISNRKIYLRWSDDNGHTWSVPLEHTMGEMGEFWQNVSFLDLGVARNRIYELFWSSPIATALNGAYADITKLENT